MENNTKAIQNFNQFATDKLNTHLAELSTRYGNEAIDKETIEKAYHEHTEIFRQELDEKLKELSTGQQNEGLQTALQSQQQAFLKKLSSNQPTI